MANPARELADYLTRWILYSQSGMYATRGGTSPGDITFWRENAKAVKLVTEVDEILQARARLGKDTSHYAETLIEAYRGIFAPDYAWAAGGSGEFIPRTAINQIQSLADWLDDNTYSSSPIPPERRASVESALAEIWELIESGDLPLDVPGRLFVGQLLDSVRDLLNDATAYGEVDLLRHIYSLIGVLLSFATVAEQDVKAPAGFAAKLRNLAARLQPYTATGAFTLSLVNDIDGIRGMITGD